MEAPALECNNLDSVKLNYLLLPFKCKDYIVSNGTMTVKDIKKDVELVVAYFNTKLQHLPVGCEEIHEKPGRTAHLWAAN